MLLALTVTLPVDPDTILGSEMVFGLALELATLMSKEPLSVIAPTPRLPDPVALPTCNVVPV